MFWAQGGSRANIFLGRSIFSGTSPAPSLAQTDSECEGDVCFVVAARLDKAGSQAILTKINNAKLYGPSCVDQAGGSELADKVNAKVSAVVGGSAADAPLTASEAAFVTKLEACYPTVQLPTASPDPAKPGQQQPAGEPKILGIPQTPFLIGAGALGLIGLIAAVARR